MNDFRADLHCHSYFSDGSDSPEELIDLAIQKNLQGLSITDHDTQAAYERAFVYAKKKNFLLLPGIEFSTIFRSESVHILSYAHSTVSPAILQLCERHKERRRKRNLEILKKLKSLKIILSEEEVFTSIGTMGSTVGNTVGRPHIAQKLIEKGVVSSFKEAFQKYLGEGRAAYVEGEVISIEETLEAIHRGGGKAIIAHPMLIKRSNIMKKLLELPFDGIEGYYAEMYAHEEAPFIEQAHKKGWLVTGGSDYHGPLKPHNPLGCSWIGKESFEILYSHYVAQSSKAL